LTLREKDVSLPAAARRYLDVNQLLKQFEQMQKMMKQFGIGGNLHGKKSRRNRAALLKGLGGGMPQ